MKLNMFQVHKAYRVNVDLPRRPTPALTNQIRYLGVLQPSWPINFTTLTNKNNTERSRNLDSATTGSPSKKEERCSPGVCEPPGDKIQYYL